MRLAARVLLPGTGWVAFKQLIELVVLWMDLLGKRVLPRQSLALYDFHTMKAVCEATISFSVRRPAFSNTNFEDTLSLRLVLVIVRANDLMERFMVSVARFAARSSCAILNGIAAGAAARIFPITRPFAKSLSKFGGKYTEAKAVNHSRS